MLRTVGSRLRVLALILLLVAGLSGADLALFEQEPAVAEKAPPGELRPDKLPLLPAGAPVVPDSEAVEPVGDAPPVGADVSEALATDGVPGDGLGEESVVKEELTTPTKEVFENTDGSVTEVVNTEPVRFEDPSGEWQDIDESAEADGDGSVSAASSPVAVEVPGDPDDGLVRDESPAGVIEFGHPDVIADPEAPEVDGEVAVVADGSGDVSSSVRFTGSGFEQDLVWSDASAAQPSFDIAVTLPEGVTARPGGVGVEFVGTDGKVVSSFGGGLAFDSSSPAPGEHAETAAVTSLVGQSARVATVRVSVDPVWLADPARVWPVTVDPVYYRSTAGNWGADDTFVQSNISGSSQYGNPELKVGTYDGGATVRRSLLWFDMGLLPFDGEHRKVSEAHLAINNKYSATCDARSVTLYKLAWDFDAGTTWADQPASAGDVVTNTFGGGYNGSCPGTWQNFDVTGLAREWIEQDVPNYGIGLRASNEGDSWASKYFHSGDSPLNGSAPALYITYNDAPSAPPQGNATPGNEEVLTTPTPTLMTETASDSDGSPVLYRFRVATGPDAESGAIVAESGWFTPAGGANPSWTVPELADGVYYWHIWTSDGQMERVAPWANQFTINRRLGSSTLSPTDSVGPVTVNLATGNGVVTTSSPTFPTIGGGVGLSYTYNSQAPANHGLTGQYFIDSNFDHDFSPSDPLAMTRVDPQIGHWWNHGAPSPGMFPDKYLIRWTGFIKLPSAGNWTFGMESDDGARVKIGQTTVLNNWVTQAQTTVWAPAATSMTTDLTPITVEYFEDYGDSFVKLLIRDANGVAYWVPSDWLYTASTPLPQGWTMSADLDGDLNAARLQVANDSVTVVDAEGATRVFKRAGNDYTPPPKDESVLSKTDTGYMLQEVSGLTYLFDNAGQLLQARSALDDRNPAAPSYTWASPEANAPARLTKITDPVTGREITLSYFTAAGTCPGVTPNPVNPPPWMLCKVNYWDGTNTVLQYNNKQLSRIIDPGTEVTNFGYDTNGKLNTIQDPLSADAVAAQQFGIPTGYQPPTASGRQPAHAVHVSEG